MVFRRGPHFDANVDPALLQLLERVGRTYAPYDVELFSGHADRPTNPGSYHPRGGAIDLNLIDRNTGKVLPNIRDPSSAAAYQAFANAAYQAADPEMQKRLRWGGYFKQGVPFDWMHFDVGGADKMAHGSWAGGFNPDIVQQLGLSGAGGIAGLDAQMQAAGYTPEQRRNAIASIESAGSGDYKALGAWTGDPTEGRDRAYGRYQVMGKNIGPWAEQYLKKSGITAEQFLADPALQDQLFDAVYGDYVAKHGERGAASKWFTGSPDEPYRTDVNGKLYGKTYADKYMAALGAPAGGGTGGAGSGGSGAENPYAGLLDKDGKDKKDNALATMAKMAMTSGGTAWQPPQIEPTPAAARIDAPVTPAVDPAQTDARKQQLAMILARLNQGSLV